MKNGICPMCQSTEVYVNATHTWGLMLEGPRGRSDIAGANCSAYVCKNCGFTALYTNSIIGGDLSEDLGWKKVV